MAIKRYLSPILFSVALVSAPRAAEHARLEWKLVQYIDRPIRVELRDGTRLEPVFVHFVHYGADTLTVAADGGRPEQIAMASISRLWVRKGEAWKGAGIGALVGLALDGLFYASIAGDEDSELFWVFAGPLVVIGTTVIGALIGGADHWVAVYP